MPIQKINRSQIEQFGSLELLARQVVEGFIVGLHKSPFHGFSVEFAEHRQYNAGESIKHIDWKLFGRTDKLYVKRYEEETNLRCQIILDISSSMHFPVVEKPSLTDFNKLSFSIYCAAAIMHLLHRQRDASGLTIFSDQILQHTACKSSGTHQKYLYSLLEQYMQPQAATEQKQTTSIADSIHQIAEKIHKRSLVILFSDMFETTASSEALFAALQHLKYNKHEVILFHVTDKQQELQFDFDNRPYRFIDLESGQELKLNPHDIKEHYLKQIRAYKHALELKCGQYKIDYVEADIRHGFRDVLLPYLTKRERMM